MAGLLAMRSEELEKVKQFEHWGQPDFLLAFFLASAMGSILNYSIFLCTLYNSALTTTVVGCLKNVLTTYIGVGAHSGTRHEQQAGRQGRNHSFVRETCTVVAGWLAG